MLLDQFKKGHIMKQQITMKSADKLENLYTAPYCSLQRVLMYSQQVYYVANQYGWRCDIYRIGNLHIATGYGTPKGIQIPYEISEQIEDKANELLNARGDNMREKLEAILIDAINTMEQ